MLPIPDFHTRHGHIRLMVASDASELLDYYWRNRTHLAPWEPARAPDFYEQQSMLDRILEAEGEFHTGKQIKLGVFNDQNSMLASVDFSQIVWGPMQACFLGYSIDAQQQGKGLMQEYLQPCMDFVFQEIGLHRIQASYMTSNQRSGKLLEKLGFEKEGIAKQYLKIGGQWHDHVLTAKISPYTHLTNSLV